MQLSSIRNQGRIFLAPFDQEPSANATTLYINIGSLYCDEHLRAFPKYSSELLKDICSASQFEDVEREVGRFLDRKGLPYGKLGSLCPGLVRSILKTRLKILKSELSWVLEENSYDWRHKARVVIVDKHSSVVDNPLSISYDTEGEPLLGRSSPLSLLRPVWPPVGCNLVVTVPGTKLRDHVLSSLSKMKSSRGSSHSTTRSSLVSSSKRTISISVSSTHSSAYSSHSAVYPDLSPSKVDRQLDEYLEKLDYMRNVGEISEYYYQHLRGERLQCMKSANQSPAKVVPI